MPSSFLRYGRRPAETSECIPMMRDELIALSEQINIEKKSCASSLAAHNHKLFFVFRERHLNCFLVPSVKDFEFHLVSGRVFRD